MSLFLFLWCCFISMSLMEANWYNLSKELKDLILRKLSDPGLGHFSQKGLTTLMLGLSRMQLRWNEFSDPAKQFLFEELERYFGFFTENDYCPIIVNALRKLEVSYDDLSDRLSTVMISALNNSLPSMNLEVEAIIVLFSFFFFLFLSFFFFLFLSSPLSLHRSSFLAYTLLQ
jgi:hypothetical protein